MPFNIHKNTFFVNTLQDVFEYLFADEKNVVQESCGCFFYGERIGIFKKIMPTTQMSQKKEEHCIRIWKTKTVFDYWYDNFNLNNIIISMDYYICKNYVKLKFITLSQEIKNEIKLFNSNHINQKLHLQEILNQPNNNYLGLFISAILHTIHFAKKNNLNKLRIVVRKDDFLQFWKHYGFVQMSIIRPNLLLIELKF